MFIIFSGIAYYIYTRYYKTTKTFTTNNEFVGVNSNVIEAQLILFHTVWCPHCKTTMDLWNTLKLKPKYTQNYIITFTDIDCEKESAYADTFDIKEYPTIILLKGDKKYIYDANLNEETLDLFINTIMTE